MFGITFVAAAIYVSMSPLDPDVPPAGEEIHLPGPSIQPLLLAVGITIGLVGITTFFAARDRGRDPLGPA